MSKYARYSDQVYFQPTQLVQIETRSMLAPGINSIVEEAKSIQANNTTKRQEMNSKFLLLISASRL